MIFQKLTKTDIAAHTGGQRRGANEEYVEFLKTVRVGQGGRVDVKQAEVSRQTVKNRLNRAASDLGKGISYVRSSPDWVVFEIVNR